MDDLTVGVDLTALPCLLLGQIDRAAHAEAESGGFRYDHFHQVSPRSLAALIMPSTT